MWKRQSSALAEGLSWATWRADFGCRLSESFRSPMRPVNRLRLPLLFRSLAAIILLVAGASSPAWTSEVGPPSPGNNKDVAQTIISSAEPHSPEPALVETKDKDDRDKDKDIEDEEDKKNDHLAHSLLQDQKAIWTSPWRLRTRDLYGLAPVAMGTFGLVSADNAILRHFGPSPMAHCNSFSNYTLAAVIGGAAGFYLSGTLTHDDHAREAGLLAGEAAVNGVIVAEAMKLAFER